MIDSSLIDLFHDFHSILTHVAVEFLIGREHVGKTGFGVCNLIQVKESCLWDAQTEVLFVGISVG